MSPAACLGRRPLSKHAHWQMKAPCAEIMRNFLVVGTFRQGYMSLLLLPWLWPWLQSQSCSTTTTGAARDCSWPQTPGPQNVKCEDRALGMTSPDGHKVGKAPGASLYRDLWGATSQRNAMAWNWELLTIRRESKERWTPFQNRACCSCLWHCLAKVMGYGCGKKKLLKIIA